MTAGSGPSESEHGSGWLGRGLIAGVGWYRDAVSPALPPRCRFYPTCSSYAVTALQRYGAARGSWLALRRIIRCGPWHPGGVDHVPSAPAQIPVQVHGACDSSDHLDVVAKPKTVGPQRRPASQESAVA